MPSPTTQAAPSSLRRSPPRSPPPPRRIRTTASARRVRVPVSRNVNVPVSARARLQSALIGTERSAVRAGYLHRHQQKGRSFYGAHKYTWVWTYFVARDGILQRFDDIHGSGTGQPTIVYPLRGATVDKQKGKPKVLKISFPKSSGIHASLTLRAQNVESANTWRADLLSHCAEKQEVEEAKSEGEGKEEKEKEVSRPNPPRAVEAYSSASQISMLRPRQRGGGPNPARPITPDPSVEQALSVRVSGVATMNAMCGVLSRFSIHPPENADDEWDDAIGVELVLNEDEGKTGSSSTAATTRSTSDLVGTKGGASIRADVSLAFNEDRDDHEEVNGTYCITRAGTWLLKVAYCGHPVFGSPFRVAAQASYPDPMACVVTGDGIRRIDYSGALQTVFVEVRDKFGNTCAWRPTHDKPIDVEAAFSFADAADVVSGGGEDNIQSYRCDVKDAGAGYFEVSFAFPVGCAPQTARSCMLQIFLNGDEIKGSPFNPELNVVARIESLLHPNRRPSVHQMRSRGLLKEEGADTAEGLSSTSFSGDNSFRARRASLLESLASRDSAYQLRGRGILRQPSPTTAKRVEV